MGLSVHLHPDHLVAEAGPVDREDRRKFASVHDELVESLRTSFPQLTVTASASEDGLTRSFRVDGLTERTRYTVYAAAAAGHQRFPGAGVAWGGPG